MSRSQPPQQQQNPGHDPLHDPPQTSERELEQGLQQEPEANRCEDPLRHGLRLQQRGEWRQAALWAQQILERQPDSISAWNQLGKALQEIGDLGQAVHAYEQAAGRDHRDVICRVELGYLFRNMAMPEEAIHWHGEALALQPDELILQLNHLCVLPIVAQSNQQIEQLRQRCVQGLIELEQRPRQWRFNSYPMSHHPFYLIYHNRDDRRCLESYGRLLTAAIQLTPPPLPPAPRRKPRIRIAFLSAYFHAHSNSRAFEGLIRHLDRNRFEVVVVHLSPGPRDAVRIRIDACADQVLTLNHQFEPALRQLLALDLDLLYFTDIGMHPFATMLACQRIAPLQLAGWGVPQTSGLSSIDAYISTALAEPPDADSHYTEQLIRLPGPPCCFLSDNLERPDHSRDYFFLPQDQLLLGCLQTIWKLPPDFDLLLARIAARVPEAWFVFVEGEITSHTQIFLERLQRSAPAVAARLILLSRMQRHEFIALAGCLDLLLDPPYFSSGVTMFECLHTGTPIVGLEGEFLRSRILAAAYRWIGLQSPPLAADAGGYVATAVRLCEDPALRQRLRREIGASANRRLYDRLEGIEAFADFASDRVERLWQEAAR
jgi:protein O-GlcNAc transferase